MLTGFLLAAAPAVAAGGVDTGMPAAGVARAMAGERAALDAGAAERISEFGQATRPMARGEAGAAVASSRNAPQDTQPKALDFATLDALPAAKGDAQWACLATAIYFESRGEPLAGQVAVAEVILNRVDDRRYPSNICAVTTQGADQGRACQFSYACDGRADSMQSPVPRARAEKLAAMMIDGQPRSVTRGATHFHATYVRPGWSTRLTRTAAIGQHMFYRYPTRTAQN